MALLVWAFLPLTMFGHFYLLLQATLSLIGNADNGDVDDEGDGQLSLSYLPEHAAILLSVLTYAPIILPDNLFRPTVTLPSLLHTLTLF